MKINDRIKVKYIGEGYPISLQKESVYQARIIQPTRKGKQMIGVIDESGEEYGYPLDLFEVEKEL